MSSLDRLPDRLIELVVIELGRCPTRHALLFVSSSVSAAAQRVLLAHIDLSTERRAHGLLALLEARPDCRRFVRSLHWPGRGGVEVDHIARILSLTFNLRRLRLAPSDDSQPNVIAALRPVLVKLEHLGALSLSGKRLAAPAIDGQLLDLLAPLSDRIRILSAYGPDRPEEALPVLGRLPESLHRLMCFEDQALDPQVGAVIVSRSPALRSLRLHKTWTLLNALDDRQAAQLQELYISEVFEHGGAAMLAAIGRLRGLQQLQMLGHYPDEALFASLPSSLVALTLTGIPDAGRRKITTSFRWPMPNAHWPDVSEIVAEAVAARLPSLRFLTVPVGVRSVALDDACERRGIALTYIRNDEVRHPQLGIRSRS